MTWITAYILAGIAFGAMDSVWLRWAGPNLYRPTIGEILADGFRKGPAMAFYVIYVGGMVWFAIRPGIASGDVVTAMTNGAILGLVSYATFDLTNQAVMRIWSTRISLADIAWGACATSAASFAACWITLELSS